MDLARSAPYLNRDQTGSAGPIQPNGMRHEVGMRMRKLTDAEKEALYTDGFVVLRGIVPIEQARDARRLVNTGLGELRATALQEAVAARAKDESISRDGAERIKEATFTSMRAGADPAILGLVGADTDLISAIGDVLGGVRKITGAQLATNFPKAASERVNESGYPDKFGDAHAVGDVSVARASFAPAGARHVGG